MAILIRKMIIIQEHLIIIPGMILAWIRNSVGNFKFIIVTFFKQLDAFENVYYTESDLLQHDDNIQTRLISKMLELSRLHFI